MTQRQIEIEEIAELQSAFEHSQMKKNRPAEEPKCGRCGHTKAAHHGSDARPCIVVTSQRGCNCDGYRPPTTEPAESEGKPDLLDAVDNFIRVNAETWKGQDPDEYMNEIRERYPVTEEAKAFFVEQGKWDFVEHFDGWQCCEMMTAFLESRRPEIERKAVERFIEKVGAEAERLWKEDVCCFNNWDVLQAMESIAKDAYGLERDE